MKKPKARPTDRKPTKQTQDHPTPSQPTPNTPPQGLVVCQLPKGQSKAAKLAMTASEAPRHYRRTRRPGQPTTTQQNQPQPAPPNNKHPTTSPHPPNPKALWFFACTKEGGAPAGPLLGHSAAKASDVQGRKVRDAKGGDLTGHSAAVSHYRSRSPSELLKGRTN